MKNECTDLPIDIMDLSDREADLLLMYRMSDDKTKKKLVDFMNSLA